MKTANSMGRFLGVLVLVPAMALSVIVSTSDSRAAAPDSFADLAEKLLPTVVNISTTTVVEGRDGPTMPQLPPGSPFEDFFREFFERNDGQQRPRRATSLGSGFIISGDGYIVTNNHVIEGADEIAVILHDDTQLEAEIVGRDPKTDLAVLKVANGDDLPSVKFGNSDKSRVGDWIVAIGNPFGLGGTVTAGIISARGRDINSGPYDEYIQTDASINRGNSGGPMFNLDGDVIGINTAIYSPSGGSVGIGFAVPSNIAKNIIDQLIDIGEVKRGWLGVHIQDVTDEIAETLGMDDAMGALVANVMDGGPASESGIQPGDVILSFDGKPVEEMRRLPKIVADTPVGKSVNVEIWRDGKTVTSQIKVGELNDDVVASTSDPADNGDAKETRIEKLGFAVAALSDEVRAQFELDASAKGVIVIAVDDGGSAAEKGIRPGDIIVEVSQEEVREPGQILKRVEEAEKAGRKSVLLLVEGQSGLRFVALRIGQE